MATTRKMTFVVKEGGANGRYYVVAEGEGFRLDLLDPATAEHAEDVAEFLNKNIELIAKDKWA